MEKQLEITIKVSLTEANTILDSMGQNKLNNIFPLYVKVRGQAEEQITAHQAELAIEAQEAKPAKK